MAYNGYYASDGSINVTVVPGTSYTGLYASDGSINVVVSPGNAFVGLYAPCGAYYVTVSPGTIVPIYAPDGSMYVSTAGMPSTDIGQPVTVVSGSLTPTNPGAYYPWLFF